MPSQVKAREAWVPEANEMSASDSRQSIINSGTSDELRDKEGNVNKELLQAVQEIYSPLLKLMKVFGAYFGHTNFSSSLLQTSGLCGKQSFAHRFYCGVAVVGLWFNFAVPLVSIFYGGPMYLLLLFDLWCLLVALNGTVCLVVLPLTDTRKSRFHSFLCSVISLHTQNINLEKVISKRRKYLTVFYFFLIPATAGSVVWDVVLGIALGSFKPWNVWFGFRITSFLFLFIGCGFWLLPIYFVCLTCDLLEFLFDDLYKQMTSLRSMDLPAFRVKHNTSCDLVELADKMLSPLLLLSFSLYILFLCFNLYQIANLPEEGTPVFLSICLVWLLASSIVLGAVMMFTSRVSEKEHAV